MPSKLDKVNVGRENDKRIKLTQEQKEEIRNKYNNGNISQRALSKEYNVSRRLIGTILDEDKFNKLKEYSRQYSKEHKQEKEKRNQYMRTHRNYKKELLKNGKIVLTK